MALYLYLYKYVFQLRRAAYPVMGRSGWGQSSGVWPPLHTPSKGNVPGVELSNPYQFARQFGKQPTRSPPTCPKPK